MVMEQSEQMFIQGINEKCEKAFHDLFIRFHNYLVVFALRRVRLLEVAEDIVQEVFVFIWESDKVYNSYTGFKAYLYELVQNRCLNYLKHKAVEEKYMAYMQKFGEDSDCDNDFMQEEIYRELYLLAKGLPEKCRRVFELTVEGKKNGEIADLLGISILTVKAHKQNALRYLRERAVDLLLFFFLGEKNGIFHS